MTITIPEIDFINVINTIGIVSFVVLALITYIGLLVCLFFSPKYVLKYKAVYFMSSILSPVGMYNLADKYYGWVVPSTILILCMYIIVFGCINHLEDI